jgi:hypothetical protein
MLVYVDDLLVARDNLGEIDSVKEQLGAELIIKNLGDSKYFLGMELARTGKGINLN